MARRKNTKRFDPRYFLHETVNRNDDGTVLEEANDPTPQELEETEVPEPLQESWALVARAVMTLLGSESGRKMMTAVLNKLVEVMAWLGQADDAILDKVFGAEMPPFLNQLQELGTGVTAITALADMIEGMNDEDAKVINTVVQAAAEE